MAAERQSWITTLVVKPASRSALLLLPLILYAIAWRLPLLWRAAGFFTSDEAIVGLMARQIRQGDWPVFFWGQRYMGAIESYVAAAVFSLCGKESVGALKSSALIFFIAFLPVHYDFARLTSTHRAALLSTLFLCSGPPVLVSWSVRAMAGYMETLFFGAVFLDALVRYDRSRKPTALFVAGLAAGLGWWTSQLIACFLLAGCIWWCRNIIRGVEWKRVRYLYRWVSLQPIQDRLPAVVRALIVPINIVGSLYIVLGLFVMLTGGGETTVAGLLIRATDGWKLVRYGGTWALVEIAALWLLLERSRLLRGVRAVRLGAAGFILGYSPAIIYRLIEKPPSGPVHPFSVPELLAKVPMFFVEVVPMLVGGALSDGWDSSLTLTFVMLVALAATFLPLYRRRRGLPAIASLLAASTLVLFFLSGNFIDRSSYRYLIPLIPAVSLLAANGIAALRRRSIAAGLTLVPVVAWGLQNASNASTIALDASPTRIAEWARARGVTTGYADYWIAYRFDFISGENPVLSPYRSQERQPAYAARARESSRVLYVFRVGDPLWPLFVERRRNRIIESAVIGRYRVYVVSQAQRKRAEA